MENKKKNDVDNDCCRLKTGKTFTRLNCLHLKSVEFAASDVVIDSSSEYVHLVVDDICMMEKATCGSLGKQTRLAV